MPFAALDSLSVWISLDNKWHWNKPTMTSSNGNIFRVTDQLCGEFNGHRWIPLTKASEVTRSFDVSLICAWINDWVNNREAGDLSGHRARYYVTVMSDKNIANDFFTTLHYSIEAITYTCRWKNPSIMFEYMPWHLCLRVLILLLTAKECQFYWLDEMYYY